MISFTWNPCFEMNWRESPRQLNKFNEPMIWSTIYLAGADT
ncbi:Uncharacterised protein [Citrobacter freundii]|nr:Uncharacterised protein [Citrobacter freundii]